MNEGEAYLLNASNMLDFLLGNLEEIFLLDWGSVEPEGEFGEVSELLQLDLGFRWNRKKFKAPYNSKTSELGVVVAWCQNKTN
jgi:hypothetical protein